MPISPARSTAFDILLKVEVEDAYASELLHSPKVDKLSPADRGLTTEIVMGVLRWRFRLDETIAAFSSKPLAKLDREVLTALRMGAYQLQFLTRVPASAAINESVELVKRARKASAAPFANAVLRKVAAAGVLATIDASTPEGIAREYAHPLWLVERWTAQYGVQQTRCLCEYDQQEPAASVRFEADGVQEELQADGIELAPGALVATARVVKDVARLTRTAAFREGRVAIQDEGSQLVALLVGAGSRILDCCAAPGGKTALLASRNPDAEITAAELHGHRAELLRKRVRAANVHVVHADVLDLPFKAPFDRVLADVPCSGTGTLARNPEIKWRLKPEDLADLHSRQVGILNAALRQLAPGGRAVYSTCSMEREECEDVVEKLLSTSPGFRLLEVRSELERLRAAGELAGSDIDSLLSGPYLRTVPGVHPCDGFFAAIIERAA